MKELQEKDLILNELRFTAHRRQVPEKLQQELLYKFIRKHMITDNQYLYICCICE